MVGVGKTRSPPFQPYRDYTYNIAIGLDPMKVEEASCAPSCLFRERLGSSNILRYELLPSARL
jgi:hypothetical protein